MRTVRVQMVNKNSFVTFYKKQEYKRVSFTFHPLFLSLFPYNDFSLSHRAYICYAQLKFAEIVDVSYIGRENKLNKF